MKKTTTTLAVLAMITLSQSTLANSNPAPWLEVDGQVNLDVTGKKGDDYERNLRTQDAELRFKMMIKEGIKAVVKTELERALEINGKGVTSPEFDVDSFIEEAYIQIETDKVSNLPRAIITAGKHKIAFGSQLSEDPMFKDNLLYNLMNQDQVIGFTVELPQSMMKIVDSAAVSVFETEAGDLKVGDHWGVSAKATKALSKQMQAQVSAMLKDNDSSDKESRASLGLVFQTESGIKIWAEGVVSHNDPSASDDTIYGARTGASKKMGPGTVVLEYSYLKDQAQEILAAYNIEVGQNMVFSPMLRHSKDETGSASDDTTIGARLKLQYQVQKAEQNLIKK